MAKPIEQTCLDCSALSQSEAIALHRRETKPQSRREVAWRVGSIKHLNNFLEIA